MLSRTSESEKVKDCALNGPIQRQKVECGYQGLGEEGPGSQCFMATEIPFWKMKKIWRWRLVMFAHSVKALNTTELSA